MEHHENFEEVVLTAMLGASQSAPADRPPFAVAVTTKTMRRKIMNLSPPQGSHSLPPIA